MAFTKCKVVLYWVFERDKGYLSGMYKGLRAWVRDIKLEQFRLVPLYSIFLNCKEGDWITPLERRHIAETCKLFIYMCD